MKNLSFVVFLCACFLLFSCGTTQETISESPEEIKQALMEGKLIKNGDWIRATTLDGQIREFSFVGMTEDELQGGGHHSPIGTTSTT